MRMDRRVVLMSLLSLVFVACQPQVAAPSPTASPPATGAPTASPIPYPTKPVTLVVGFGAGGALDLAARALANNMPTSFGQPVTVVNQAGAAGVIAAGKVVQSPPDGYTAGLEPVAAMAVQPNRASASAPYKGPVDYTPVINLLYFQQVLAVRSDSKQQTAKEFVQFAKANPGAIRVGTSGAGSLPDLTAAAMEKDAGISLTRVPFSGFSESVPALLGGHIEALIATPSDFAQHVTAGTVKVLGTFSDRRASLFPDVPTWKEAGVNFAQDNYYFVILPKGTPASIVQRLHDALKATIETPAFKKFAADNGAIIDYKGPDALRAQLEADYKFYGELLPKLGIN